MVTRSKVLWTGTRVPSCQLTNCQVSGTRPTPTEESTATTTLLRSHKVCYHSVQSKQLMTHTGIADINTRDILGVYLGPNQSASLDASLLGLFAQLSVSHIAVEQRFIQLMPCPDLTPLIVWWESVANEQLQIWIILNSKHFRFIWFTFLLHYLLMRLTM